MTPVPYGGRDGGFRGPRGIPGGGIRKPMPPWNPRQDFPVPQLPVPNQREAGRRPMGEGGTAQHQRFLAKHGLTPETRGTGAQARFLAGQSGDGVHPARRLGLMGSRGRAGGAGGTAEGPAAVPAVGPATTPQVPAPAGAAPTTGPRVAAPTARGPAVGQPLGISASAPVVNRAMGMV